MTTKYFRTVFRFEVLSTDEDFGSGMSLADIHYETMNGHASGRFLDGTHNEVSEEDMRKLLEAQGTDPSFLIEDDEDG